MSDSHSADRTDIVAAAVLVAAALFCLFWLIPNHTEPPRSDGDISPALFPSLAAAAVLLLSVGTIVLRVLKPSAESTELPGFAILAELLIWAVVALAIRLAMPVIGFVPTAIIIVALGGAIIQYRKWWVLGLLAVLFSVIVDYGAWQIFTVDLP